MRKGTTLAHLSSEQERTMSMIDLVGWLAASMVLVTFYLKRMTPLRVVAIGSNVLFILFGLFSQTLPVMVLHCLLLPLNVWRLAETQRKRTAAHCGAINALPETLLLPLMKQGRAPRGSLLFSKGAKGGQGLSPSARRNPAFAPKQLAPAGGVAGCHGRFFGCSAAHRHCRVHVGCRIWRDRCGPVPGDRGPVPPARKQSDPDRRPAAPWHCAGRQPLAGIQPCG